MSTEKAISKEKMLSMYKVMVKIRAFENQAIELAKGNITRAAVHTYQGEEAIAAGVCAHLTKDDYITSTHRGHGHCIAKGADLYKMFAELMGREDGYCKGKGGSMHIADLNTGNLGANGIVGGGIPLAMGAGLGLQLDHSDRVSVCFFGDGASNEGSFHETLNMASVWSLPVIFICENNKYGISTHVSKSMHVKSVADRAVGYGIDGYKVDGNDVVAVYNLLEKVLPGVRSGKGPVLIEMDTYMMTGHYFGDNQNYRTKEEVNEWKPKDPILRCEKVLAEEYGVAEDEMKKIHDDIKKEVLEACEKAQLNPEPKVEDLTEDLYDDTMADITWIPFDKKAAKAKREGK